MTPFIEIFKYDLPLVRRLELKGRTITRRQGLILKVGRGAGKVGYGDIAPLPNFSIETLDEARDALIRWSEMFKNPPDTDEEEKAFHFLLHTPSVLFGTECATLALTQSAIKKPPRLHRERKSVAVCGLVDAVGDLALQRVQELRDRRFSAVKLKLGRQDVERDLALVCEVSAMVGDSMRIRLDANRAWDFDRAMQFSRGIKNCPIDFIEEPLADPRMLPDLAAHSRLPIALDESIIDGLYDDEQFMDMQWAKAVILKPTLLGGLRSCEELAYEAIEHGVQPIVSSSYESGVGLVALAHLAAALTEDDVPAGLDTYGWLADDVLDQRFEVRNGRLNLEELDACAATINTGRMETVVSG